MAGKIYFGLVLALLGLAGCGFRPLYGEDSAIGSADLSRVRVDTIQDVPDPTGRSVSTARVGQLLRNYLLDRITPRGSAAAPQYVLKVYVGESKNTAIGIRSDESATRATLVLTASYSLSRTDGGGAILSTRAQSYVSYNVLRDEFATLAAEKDARQNAARELSETISLDVANAVGAVRSGAVK
jgi:LPS-assembly lipoprotein